VEPELGNSKEHEHELDLGDFLQGNEPDKHREFNVEDIDTPSKLPDRNKEKDDKSEESEESDEKPAQQHANP